MQRFLPLMGLLASTALLAVPAQAAEYHFERVATIKLPGLTGHGDITTYDPMDQMLYVSMPNDGLCVVDTRSRSVVKYIQNIPSPNGSSFDADNVYVAAGDGAGAGKINDVIVISKESWKEVGRAQTDGTSPDGLVVEPKSHLLYVASDDNNNLEVYKTGKKLERKAVWPLYPDNPVAGPDVFTVVPSKNWIFQSDDSWELRLNMTTGAIEAKVDTHVKLLKHGGTKGSIFDAKNDRLWVGTTNKNPGIFVIDPNTMSVIKTIPEKGGVDVVAFDPGLELVYAFEGGAKGFDVYDANTMQHVAFVSTGSGNTHTGDVDPESHLVYAYEGDAGAVSVWKPVR